MILHGTLTFIVCWFFFFYAEEEKRVVLRSFLNLFTCIVHPLLKLFSLVERKHLFKSLQMCVIIEVTLEFQMKLVI